MSHCILKHAAGVWIHKENLHIAVFKFTAGLGISQEAQAHG